MARKGAPGARQRTAAHTSRSRKRKAVRTTKEKKKVNIRSAQSSKTLKKQKVARQTRAKSLPAAKSSADAQSSSGTLPAAVACFDNPADFAVHACDSLHGDGLFSNAARGDFLADVQHALSGVLCKTLPLLTVHTGRAFLSVAKRGDGTSSTPCLTRTEGASGDCPTKNRLTNSGTPREGCPDGGAEEWGVHEEIYRTVRSTIAASCVLGHRSCQALWGPRGCGKHRILRLVAQECAQEANTLVLYLNGGLLRSDVSALRVIAEQMLRYLRSPQSAALRAADWSMRTGVFDFGRLFHFDDLLATSDTAVASAVGMSNHGATAPAELLTQRIEHDTVQNRLVSHPSSFSTSGAHGVDYEAPPCASRSPAACTKNEGSCTSSDDDEEEDEDSESDAARIKTNGVFLTTTSAFLAGGASSALPALRQALLRMKSCGTTLVVCIRQVDLFGIWCDQLLYVLSGLMHDADGHGGGMSLLLSSASPDLRYLEKRLSSRLTCETRYVPLLPWSVSGLLRATLRAVRHCCLPYAQSHGGSCEPPFVATGLSTDIMADVRREVKDVMEGNVAPSWRSDRVNGSHRTLDTMGTSRQQQKMDSNAAADVRDGSATPVLSFGNDAVCAQSGDAPHVATHQSDTQRVSLCGDSLYTHPSLFASALVAMCDELCDQLTSRIADDDIGADALARCVTRLSRELADAGATAERVLTGLSACLCKASAGGLSLLGAEGQARLLRWLREREAAWPWLAKSTCGATSPTPAQTRSSEQHNESKHGLGVWQGRAPPRVRASWQRLVTMSPSLCTLPSTLSASAASTLPLSIATLPPDLLDLLADGHLVQSGYAARELFLLLVQLLLHHEAGITRSVADVLEDISSGMGTRAAASLDRAAFRHALDLLTRWRLVHVAERTELVTLIGGVARVRGFVLAVLEHRTTWCEDVLGLEAREYLRIRNTV